MKICVLHTQCLFDEGVVQRRGGKGTYNTVAIVRDKYCTANAGTASFSCINVDDDGRDDQ